MKSAVVDPPAVTSRRRKNNSVESNNLSCPICGTGSFTRLRDHIRRKHKNINTDDRKKILRSSRHGIQFQKSSTSEYCSNTEKQSSEADNSKEICCSSEMIQDLQQPNTLHNVYDASVGVKESTLGKLLPPSSRRYIPPKISRGTGSSDTIPFIDFVMALKHPPLFPWQTSKLKPYRKEVRNLWKSGSISDLSKECRRVCWKIYQTFLMSLSPWTLEKTSYPEYPSWKNNKEHF